MPRYYFHARSGAEHVRDFEGVELDDLEGVREYVLAIAAELKVEGWVFDVTDDRGNVQIVISTDELSAPKTSP